MLLRRLAYCGACGQMMSTNHRQIKGVTYRYYFCPRRYPYRFAAAGEPLPDPCRMPWVEATALEDAVWTDVVRFLDDPERWLHAQQAVEASPAITGDAERLNESLARVRRAGRPPSTWSKRISLRPTRPNSSCRTSRRRNARFARPWRKSRPSRCHYPRWPPIFAVRCS